MLGSMIPSLMGVSIARRLLISAMGLGLMTAACGAGAVGKPPGPGPQGGQHA